MTSHYPKIRSIRCTLGFGFFLTTVAFGATTISGLSNGPRQMLSALKLNAPTIRQSSNLVADAGKSAKPKSVAPEAQPNIVKLSDEWQRVYALEADKTVEISVHLESPSTLPANGRIAVSWTLEPKSQSTTPPTETKPARDDKALGIYAAPTANWRKVLHALDSDITLVYRAPVAGNYTLRLVPVTDEEPVGNAGRRWREKGGAPLLTAISKETPWPAGFVAPMSVQVKPLVMGSVAEQEKLRTIIEAEPNDTPELAQPINLSQTAGNEIQTWEITGSADDNEFFDNGRVGQSGDDWFRINYTGTEPRLLTAQLSMPGQDVAARIRAYKLKSDGAKDEKLTEEFFLHPSAILPLEEYSEGQDANERAHQQEETHRANICRLLKPGVTFFLRVEANTPGYQLQLRVLKPAPYDDPRLAVRQAIYTQIGQVDAWLTNRPRGASVERRIRDSGNLLGTGCMSCHTQAGVWGPAVPFTQGYRPENVQNYRHLINVMYECLRPTNELKDAANNTSLSPLDVGDGPAGTRAAGFNIVNLERFIKPRKLHSAQQIRTANYVMQTADPGGINAAGPGSNIGRVIVWTMATEILKTAWESSNDPKYFRKLEEKARSILGDNVQFTDDVALRLNYFHRVLPIKEYAALAEKARKQEQDANLKVLGSAEECEKFIAAVQTKLKEDEARLRAIQNADGSWGFNPGSTADEGKTWKQGDASSDPSPTALGVLGLSAAGYGADDPAIARGVKSLLASQEPTGRWNKAAQTGFVTTAYVLHALSRLYPATPEVPTRADFTPQKGESPLQTIKRVQALAQTSEPKFADLMRDAATHENTLVRYWAMIGLGGTHTNEGVPVLVNALADRTKIVRDAATWALRQTLLDDKGWEATFAAYEKGNDDTRQQVLQVLNMRADAVMSKSSLDWTRLTALFDRALNQDAHPAVRAWATKAAWQWWIWNPPVRGAINASWITMLQRPEPNALVENTMRYSSQALFIANGHKANGSKEHQYKELATLFASLTKRLDTPKDAETKARLARRLVSIGGTFYDTAGGDGGSGQMGYSTSGSGEMMGKATLAFLESATKSNDMALIRAGIEGGSNVPYAPLTVYLVDYSLNGPLDLRQLSAEAVGDPRSAKLAAVPEQVEPQLEQIRRGALDAPRRPQLSDPILKLWGRVNWIVPQTVEQQRNFLNLMIPRFDNYLSPEQIAAITDPAKRAAAERDMDAAWYLADKLGAVLQENPDLHLEIVFREYFPTQFRNPLEEHFWVRNVEWLLTFKPTTPIPVPEKNTTQAATQKIAFQLVDDEKPKAPNNPAPALVAPPDLTLSIKDRALQLYLDLLKPTANPKSRAIAIGMANKTALRTNPEVLRALAEVQTFEKDKELLTAIENVLKQGNEKFLPELVAFLKREKHPSVKFDAKGEAALTKEQSEDIFYFRDFVLPEMSRQKRNDQQSCMGCHGQEGRVPSFTMKPPDAYGYIPVADLMFDYRVVQEKIDLNNLDKSKLLRKPLNIQDGQEDGHQGGRRYVPTDEGYLILRKWVENQPRILKSNATSTTP